MVEGLLCWHCGGSLDEVRLPLRRLEVCPACDVELHCCKMCQFYNPRVSDGCDEDRAEEVMDKERANFCDFFKPSPNAYVSRDGSKAQSARIQLNRLFDDVTDLETPTGTDAQTQEGTARQRLEELFGSVDKDKR